MKAYEGDSTALHYVKSDLEILKEHHQFLLDDDDEDGGTWEMRMVKAYHDHLYKEYCLTDLSRVHLEGSPIGLRWRTEKEVRRGKGQFSCGSLHCSTEDGLTSWELPFGYIEKGEKKMALVKVRLCPSCSTLLPSPKRTPFTSQSIDLLP